MLHTACSELLEGFVIRGCEGVSISNFNKGLNAFMDNRSINRCQRDQAGLFLLVFCEQHF